MGLENTYCLCFRNRGKFTAPVPHQVDLDLAFLGPISFEPQLPCKAEYYLHFIEEASRVQKGEMSYPQTINKETTQLPQVLGQDDH